MGVYTCGLSVRGECHFLAVFCMDILFEDWERWEAHKSSLVSLLFCL